MGKKNMDANRQQSPEPEHGPQSLEALEEQLRRLPEPKVPEDLEAKLIAAIPAVASIPQVARPRKWQWSAGAVVAAAAALVVLFLLLPRGRNPDAAQRPSAPDNRRLTQSTRGALAINSLKETDPCNILPPLPDWR
jgi:hypothetical protein